MIISTGACGSETDDDPMSLRCVDAGIDAGLVGQTRQRTCDIGNSAECVEPAPGFTVDLFDRYAQLDDDGFGSGTLDPEAVKLATTTSGADGTFELEVPFGNYYACAPDGDDRVTCSRQIIIDEVTPLFTAYFEFGNGPLWSVRPCDD